MIADDSDRARLARIERQLEREDPELAEALHQWSPGAMRSRAWAGWLTVGVGLVLVIVAVLVWSTGWALLAAIVLGAGWFALRTVRDESAAHRPGGPWSSP